MEKLAGDLLLGLKFVRLEILSTSFIDFLYEELGELKSRWPERVNVLYFCSLRGKLPDTSKLMTADDIVRLKRCILGAQVTGTVSLYSVNVFIVFSSFSSHVFLDSYLHFILLISS